MRILIVDDTSSDLQRMSLLLRNAGYYIKEAQSGEEAFAILTSEGCDVLITDFRMQKRSGEELIEWARHNRPDIKTVLVSTYQLLPTVAANCRAHAYWHKSYPEDHLRQMIQGIARQKD